VNGTINFPGYLTIFPGANVNPNSPDSNLINIFAQAKEDVLIYGEQVYNSFNPDTAVGTILDARCAINGIIRQGPTYTQQPISVTCSQTGTTIYGLDLQPTSPFTVSDQQGNLYNLVTTYEFTATGTQSLLFQAALSGPVQSNLNTITIITTSVSGISSVNNPLTYNSLGQTEESDSALRIRRASSVSLPSKGFLQGLYAGLLSISGVEYASVFENDTNTVNSYGVAPHGIWVVVTTNTTITPALAEEIATVIYNKRNAGCAQTNTGTGATATCTVSGGSITGVTVTNGGTGYIYPPDVVIVSGGSGALAYATISGGAVTAVTVSTGSGYTSAPTVVITGSGTGGAATAIVNEGMVTGFTITNAGTGYTTAPTISFTGGGGTGATAIATVSGGLITAITPTSGSGYTSAPTVTIAGNGSGAVFTATVSGGTVTSYTQLAGGTGYTTTPSVILTGGGGTGASITLNPTNGSLTTGGAVINNAGTGYTTAPIIEINPNTTVYNYSQVDGSIFPIYFDSSIPQPFYFTAYIEPIVSGGIVPSFTSLQNSISEALRYSIGQSADSSSIVAILKGLAPNCYVYDEGVSATYSGLASPSPILAPTGVNYQLQLPPANIILKS